MLAGMRKIMVILGVIAVGAVLHKHFEQKKAAAELQAVDFSSTPKDLLPERDESLNGRESSSAPYRCDGRNRCPQMHSCEEATWFLENCPGMKMDGDGDGIPCEDQYCRAAR